MNNTTKFDGPKDTAQMKLEISQYVDLLKCVGDVIQQAKEIPSGVLYSHLMTIMDLRQFYNVVGAFKRAGLVKEKSHMLIWCGPDAPVE
jgi:hypothetical protein